MNTTSNGSKPGPTTASNIQITPPVGPGSRSFGHSDGHTYPEGGLQAWLVVAGAFAAMLSSLGVMNTLGVFQAYISTHQLADYDESAIGWIFSVYAFFAFFCGVQIGPIFDAKGPRLLILSGSILVVLSMMLLGICTKYWHFMLNFGVINGVGCSLLFTPAMTSIGHFFMVKRGGATGLAAAGGSLGGIIFPLMLQSLLPKVGWAWSTRILGFILMFLCLIANLLIRSRLPPKEGGSVMPDIRIFTNLPFLYTSLSIFFMEWGLFVPVTYLISYSLSSGAINTTLSYQIMAIFNTGSCFGRYLPGIFADMIGRFNAMFWTLALCGLTTLVLWLPATILPLVNEGAQPSRAIEPLVIIYSLLFGFASGSNISLTPVCVGQLCDTNEYGRYYATCYCFVSFATLTGIPIAGSILQACANSYWGVVVFTGASYVVAVAFIIAARALRVGGWMKWVRY
ncbi:monocarboxylate transporter [Rhizodiscina lignyota]|uniref:Monocarboxylate transporter n=1 Tax=Rhizodiscina lignyota TaxID=1504668 RepID=A0A9P4IJC8_9PEZI|nr:monocarboxylate transporter [Rhizodiscina lignyota]